MPSCRFLNSKAKYFHFPLLSTAQRKKKPIEDKTFNTSCVLPICIKVLVTNLVYYLQNQKPLPVESLMLSPNHSKPNLTPSHWAQLSRIRGLSTWQLDCIYYYLHPGYFNLPCKVGKVSCWFHPCKSKNDWDSSNGDQCIWGLQNITIMPILVHFYIACSQGTRSRKIRRNTNFKG